MHHQRLNSQVASLFTLLAITFLAPCALADSGRAAGFIPVEGGQLYYEAAGAGDPILLLHDALMHRETWNLQFEALAISHKVVRYDRRGYGKSPAPIEPYSLVEDVEVLRQTLNLDRSTIIGVSAGARLAVDYTIVYPDRVSALVLTGPVVSGMEYTSHFYNRGGRVSSDRFADRAAMLDYYVQDDPYNIAPGNDEARAVAKALLDANPHNFNTVNNQFARWPQQPAMGRLDEIRVPTLVVVGEFDIADVHAHSGALEGGIPGAQRVVIPGAGHFVQLEQPAQFMTAVVEFMDGGTFTFLLRTEGAAAAADHFHQLRQEDPSALPFDELVINQAGYNLMFQGKPADAVTLLRLNIEAFPDSFNAYDSLGEALLAAGDRQGAEANYRKSLELNPDNDNAVQVLESMGFTFSE